MTRIFLFIAILMCSCNVQGSGARFQESESRTDGFTSNANEGRTLYDTAKHCQSQVDEFTSIKLYDGGMMIDIPKNFTQMSCAEIARKFPNLRQMPDSAYADERRNATVLFSLKEVKMAQEGIPDLAAFLEKQYAGVKVMQLKSSVVKINGADFAIIEFVSQAVDAKIINRVFATDIKGKLFMGTINFTENKEQEWSVLSERIIYSIKKG